MPGLATTAGSPLPVSQLPRPTATAPARTNCAALSAVTPPLGSSGISRNGPRASRTNVGPTAERREELHGRGTGAPRERISVGVRAPGSRDVADRGPLDDRGIGVGRDEEAGAGVDGPLGRLHVQDRTGADRQAVALTPTSESARDGVQCLGRVQRTARMPARRPPAARPRPPPGATGRGAGRWPRRAAQRSRRGWPAGDPAPAPWEAAAPPHPRSSSRRGAPPADEVTSRDQRRDWAASPPAMSG